MDGHSTALAAGSPRNSETVMVASDRSATLRATSGLASPGQRGGSSERAPSPTIWHSANQHATGGTPSLQRRASVRILDS